MQIIGDLNAEVTKILVDKYGQDVLTQLANVDMNSIMTLASKSRSVRSIVSSQAETTSSSCAKDSTDCNSQTNSNQRTITGICNNRQNKNFGKALAPISRLLGRASYADNVSSIRNRSVTGSPLPSTRVVSLRILAEGATPVFDHQTSNLHMPYGQFIAHDIILMPSSVGPNGQTLDCTACNSGSVTDNCAPIAVPNGDDYFPTNSCIRLTRALNGQTGLGQRTQLNQNTHFLDLSVVYGSDECLAAKLRTFKNGELKTFQYQYPLPPQDPTDSNCQSKAPNSCFLCGDDRNMVQPGLITIHTLYIKQHNKVAQAMQKLRSDWNDEKLYQEARRLLTARFQHHVYAEYLPKLLGQAAMKEFGLTPLTSGYFTGYDATLDPALPVEFTSAAFRFGHSQIRKELPRVTNFNQTVGTSVDIGNNVFYADSAYQGSAGGIDGIIEGLLQYPAMAVDRQFSFPVRHQIFEIRGKKASGIDLISVNMMRGRDVGLFPYNEYRTLVGLPKANNFSDLLGQMDAANVQALQSVYASVHDIDLYPAILMERPVGGSLLGRTGTYIIATTFARLKKADRFFYETKAPNTRSLTPDELAAIRSSSLANFFCGVFPSIQLINKDIFNLNGKRVPCATLPDIDVIPFVMGN